MSRHLSPLLFGIISGIALPVIGYTCLKRGSFQYTPQNGATQIISPTTNANAYWIVTIGTLVLGAVGIAIAGYQSVCLFRAWRGPAAAPRQPRFIKSMRILMMLLALGCVLCIVSAITGIQAFEFSAITGTQAFESDSRTGTIITYWHGSWRWLALVYAAIFAVAFYGIYRRFPLVWKVGWVVLIAGAADFIVQAWFALVRQPDGWVGAIAATLGGIAVAIYWGFWWSKQKHYFIPDATEQT